MCEDLREWRDMRLTEWHGTAGNINQVRRMPCGSENMVACWQRTPIGHHLEAGKLEKEYHGFSERAPCQTQGPEKSRHCPSGWDRIVKVMGNTWSCVSKVTVASSSWQGPHSVQTHDNLRKFVFPNPMIFDSAANLTCESSGPMNKTIEA